MPNLTLDLRNLRCALAAAEAGSFRQAAAALDLTQASVSRRVQALEHRLGFSLFERSRAGVRLTKAGAAFLESALAGAEQLDFATRHASAVHRGYCGGVRIGVSPSQTGGPLREVLRYFRESFPHVATTLTEGSPIKLRQAVASGSLDVAFVAGIETTLGCQVRELWREAVFVALPEAHPLAEQGEIEWDDIRAETFVVSHRHGEGVEECLIVRLTDGDQRPRIDVHDVSEASIFDLVTMGYGITLTYESSVRSEIGGVIFRRLAGEAGALPSSVVWSVTEANPTVPALIAIAEAVGRGEVPAALPATRIHKRITQDCAAMRDRANRRDPRTSARSQ
ncbi:MAG: LysR family transcriptional regulator [Erythrobacter sp.]|nr:LysR family transcriptional regulator [Erythrobacter sp.]